MINANWSKWIQRAVVTQFVNGVVGHTVLSETEDIDKNKLDHWCEVRVDITYTHLNGSSYKVKVSTNVLVVGAKKDNIYTCKILTGLVASIFGDISVKNDSGVYQFCLRLDGDVIDTYYGEIEDQANMEQATVEGTLESIIL